jgi:hypothetical protein
MVELAPFLIRKHSIIVSSTLCLSLICAACDRDSAKSAWREPVTGGSVRVQPPPPVANPEADEIAAGAKIEVQISDALDSGTAAPGYFIHATVTADVNGPQGKVAIPANSSGVVTVLGSSDRDGRSTLTVALYQLTVGGHSYTLTNGARQLAVLNFTQNAADGPGHRSVHLHGGSRLVFVPTENLRFSAKTAR